MLLAQQVEHCTDLAIVRHKGRHEVAGCSIELSHEPFAVNSDKVRIRESSATAPRDYLGAPGRSFDQTLPLAYLVSGDIAAEPLCRMAVEGMVESLEPA